LKPVSAYSTLEIDRLPERNPLKTSVVPGRLIRRDRKMLVRGVGSDQLNASFPEYSLHPKCYRCGGMSFG
jgi:hypothetical protein